MSADHPLGNDDHECAPGGDGPQRTPGAFEGEATPRPQLPPSFEIMTPGATEHAATRPPPADPPSGPLRHQDYFTALATAAQRAPAPSLQTPPSPSVSASDATASGHIQSVESAPTLQPLARPAAQTQVSNLSVQSTDSSATAIPGLSGLAAAHPRRPLFPDQSYAALQEQVHPRGGPPRRGGTNPHQIFTFSSAIASLHSSGARTSHNSPAATPGAGGLFNPAGHPPPYNLESPESAGTYASPFLHFTHTHVPKETHVADVDVDPISGRKLINHYEIIDELGRGTHGKVKLGRDLETKDTYVAIKIVERFSKRRKLGRLGTTEDKVKKEVAILKKARHPNIVALLEVIDDPSRKKVYIVLEWVERGEIHWREKGPKEIAMIEARRYERERAGLTSGYDHRTVVEDEAVLVEAQKRLARQKRRALRAFRQMKRETAAKPEAWSLEMAGSETSEDSGDERLSRLSEDSMSLSARLYADDHHHRALSRTPSPLPPDDHFLTRSPTHRSYASEPEALSPIDLRRSTSSLMANSSLTGLEGTMYGAYDSNLHLTRVTSLTNNLYSPRRSSAEGLARLASEILDSDLDSELEYVPVMTIEQIRVTFRDTLLGLQYLHYQGIVHRDIKPPNLLATYDNRTKISDFGVSHLGKPVQQGEAGEEISEAEAQDLDEEAKELAKTVGTPAFYAPELCITDPTDEPLPVTKAIDVWALGITLFCMLFARTPFVDNEFVVMRQIADEEVYIPRQRLQPVDNKSHSRGSSHGRAFPPMNSGRRGELDLVYEEINDELYDLLKRLLIKEPQKRITLEEVRHHPWVVADLPDKIEWLMETDPSRQSKGKKIEVSSEELNTAVVPLNLVERMRSGLKKVGERFGLGAKPSSSRLRAQSLHQRDSSMAPSVGVSDSGSNKLRADEASFVAALKASRESDHPLSRSITTTPEMDEDDSYFDNLPSRTTSRESTGHYQLGPPRPSPPHRAVTVTPASGSMRTVKQSDFRPDGSDSHLPSPGLPSTPLALATSGSAALGNALGGTGRRIIQAVKEKSAPWVIDYNNRPPSERGSIESFDNHAEPSLAVSPTTASGHVNLPDALQTSSPHSSAQTSPAGSHGNSAGALLEHLHPHHRETNRASRASSVSSTTSHGRGRVSSIRASGMASDGSRPHSRTAGDSSVEDWNRADAERIRRLIAEKHEQAERSSRPSSAMAKTPLECPPSPDDSRSGRGDSRNPSVTDSSIPSVPDTPYGISPITSSAQMMSSSSDLASAVSASISNPSIPSVISEASSMDALDFRPYHLDDKREASSDDTLQRSPRQPPASSSSSADRLDEGYTPDLDTALDSSDADDEDYASSSDSDGGLQMTRRTKTSAKHGGKGALAAAQEAAKLSGGGSSGGRHRRRNTGLSIRSRKSSRSGSNNTMRKIRTRDSIDEQRRGPGAFEATEE